MTKEEVEEKIKEILTKDKRFTGVRVTVNYKKRKINSISFKIDKRGGDTSIV